MNAMAKAVALAGGPSKMAKGLKCSPTAVGFYRDGKRDIPERLGARIERLSRFGVRRWDLWPLDWHLIWPELIGTEGAPPVPQDSEPGADHAG